LDEVQPGEAEHQDHDDAESQLDRVAHGDPVDIQGHIDADHHQHKGQQDGVDWRDRPGGRLEILLSGGSDRSIQRCQDGRNTVHQKLPPHMIFATPTRRFASTEIASVCCHPRVLRP
jgi:hypothetical protein